MKRSDEDLADASLALSYRDCIADSSAQIHRVPEHSENGNRSATIPSYTASSFLSNNLLLPCVSNTASA